MARLISEPKYHAKQYHVLKTLINSVNPDLLASE